MYICYIYYLQMVLNRARMTNVVSLVTMCGLVTVNRYIQAVMENAIKENMSKLL